MVVVRQSVYDNFFRSAISFVGVDFQLLVAGCGVGDDRNLEKIMAGVMMWIKIMSGDGCRWNF